MNEENYIETYLRYLIITSNGHEAEAPDGVFRKIYKDLEMGEITLGRKRCDEIQTDINVFFFEYCLKNNFEHGLSYTDVYGNYMEYKDSEKEQGGRQPK